MTHHALGDRIRQLRLKKGITSRELARRIGVAASFMSDLEHGRRGTEKLSEIARELGVTHDELAALDGRLTPDMADWLRANPNVVALLRESARSGRQLVLDRKRAREGAGAMKCPTCNGTGQIDPESGGMFRQKCRRCGLVKRWDTTRFEFCETCDPEGEYMVIEQTGKSKEPGR